MARKVYLYIYTILLISCGTLTGNPEGVGGDDGASEGNNDTEVVDSQTEGQQTADNNDENQGENTENTASGEGSEDGVKLEQEVEFLSNSDMLAQNDQGGGVKIFLTDAPVDDFSAIMIHLDKVSIIGEQGPIVKDIEDTLVNLLDLQAGAAALIADFAEAPAGKYSELRLILASEKPSYGVLNTGEEETFIIPSATSSGIKIKHDFELVDGQSENIVLDFDLRKSVKQRGNGTYFMTPVLRAVAHSDSGSIEVGASNEVSVVCAYTDQEAAASDSECEEAVASAAEKDGKFTLSYLPQGNYFVKIIYADQQELLIEDVVVTAGEISEVSDN